MDKLLGVSTPLNGGGDGGLHRAIGPKEESSEGLTRSQGTNAGMDFPVFELQDDRVKRANLGRALR